MDSNYAFSLCKNTQGWDASPLWGTMHTHLHIHSHLEANFLSQFTYIHDFKKWKETSKPGRHSDSVCRNSANTVNQVQNFAVPL